MVIKWHVVIKDCMTVKNWRSCNKSLSVPVGQMQHIITGKTFRPLATVVTGI